MDQERPSFYYELCRLCLDAEGICDIFKSDYLLQDIYACTGVIVFVSDKLPHKICMKCTEFIKTAKEFRVSVNQNDAHLRSMFTGDAEVDIIKTIACHTPKVISEPENICQETVEVQSAYFGNDNIEDTNQIKTNPNRHSKDESFLEEGPVVVQTISLRKDLFHSSSISSCPDSPSLTKSELIRKADQPYDEILEEKVKIENICNKMKTDKDEDIDYVCGTCSKEFVSYKKFYLHQRLHNRKWVCPLNPCGKRFATKGDLEKHVRTHTGEKPYVCGICDKGFAQRVTLRYHVRTIHQNNPEESESVLGDEHST